MLQHRRTPPCKSDAVLAVSKEPPSPAPRRQLSLLDSTSIIVGVIIGSGIYKTSSDIAANVADEGLLMTVWVLGGLLSLVGALCYAELANAYPEEGGDYVYLTRAMGRPVGFLFAWAQLWIVRPGSIGAYAFVFATYANQLWPLGQGPWPLVLYAAAAIVVLTAINLLGLREGKWTQNVLTAVKLLGLLAIIAVGLLVSPAAPPPHAVKSSFSLDGFRLAMIFVLYTYGGWNEMAYVAAEVRNPQKNILRALVLGTLAVTGLYVLVNLAFLHALGLSGAAHSPAIAADAVARGLGPWSARAVSLLICLSSLGAINGMILTGARIYYAMGRDHRLYGWLAKWNARRDTPMRAMLLQSLVVLGLVVGFGARQDGFERMVTFTTPVFWIFFLLAGASLIVLRRREPSAPRPYRVPWYPLLPVVFCLSCALMVYASVSWAIDNGSREAFWSLGLLAIGGALSILKPR
jgi:basic amino acid/polyamine antiporter, APA family